MSMMNYLVFCTCIVDGQGRTFCSVSLRLRGEWQVEDHQLHLTHTHTYTVFSPYSLTSSLLYPHPPPPPLLLLALQPCPSCLPFPCLCLSLLTHPASQLIVPDSCYSQSCLCVKGRLRGESEDGGRKRVRRSQSREAKGGMGALGEI